MFEGTATIQPQTLTHHVTMLERGGAGSLGPYPTQPSSLAVTGQPPHRLHGLFSTVQSYGGASLMSTFLRERLCCQPAPTACRRHPTHSNFQMRLAILLMVVLPCDALLAPAALPRLGAAPAAGARRRATYRHSWLPLPQAHLLMIHPRHLPRLALMLMFQQLSRQPRLAV